MGLLNFISDEQARKDMARNAMNIAQSASNAAAGNVTGLVDLSAMALRALGVPVPADAFLSSEWAKKKGFTRDVPHDAPGLAGETLGLLAPVAVSAKAPQIARGLLQGIDNMSAVNSLRKDAGVILFHGSNSPVAIKNIHDGGVFGGLFASPSERSAKSHGESLYRMTVPDEKVMPLNADLPWDESKAFVGSLLRDATYADDITDAVISGKKDAWNMVDAIPEDDLLNALRSSDLGEASWEMQRIRGGLAKKYGFKAAQMLDEHGTSYLVLPGVKPRPANDKSKNIYKSSK